MTLRSLSVSGSINLGDDKKLNFGAVPDYEIYHNSTTNVNHISSLIDRQLSINANQILLTNQANDSTYLNLTSSSATFSQDITIGSTGASSDKTLFILTGGTNSSIKLMEAGTLYGFSQVYDGVNNQFFIKRHSNSASGSVVVTMNRDNDSITLAGNLSSTSSTVHFSLANMSAYQLNGTYVMDSSRNLVNIGNFTGAGSIKSTLQIDNSTLPDVPSEHVILLNPPITTDYYGGGISWSEGTNTAASLGVYDNGSGGALGMYFATGSNSGISEALRLDKNQKATFYDDVTVNGTEYINNIQARTSAGIKLGNDNFSGFVQVADNGQVNFDSGNSEIHFLGSGTTFGKIFKSSDNFYINNPIQDKDIIFSGNDGGSSVTMLTLDASNAGSATFNDDIDYGGKLTQTGTGVNYFKGSGYSQIKIANNLTANTNKQSGIITENYEGNNVSLFQTFQQNNSNAIYYGSADSAFCGVQSHYFMVNTDSNTSGSGHTTALTISIIQTLRLRATLQQMEYLPQTVESYVY